MNLHPAVLENKVVTPSTILNAFMHPEWDNVSSIKPKEAAFIYNFLLENKLNKTLEIGFAMGMSTCHIMAATKAKHIAVDPFQNNYGYFGIKNLTKLNLIHNLDFREDFSHAVLPKLLEAKQNFHFIFIDGDHKFDGMLLDFYHSDLLLEKGGYILFHDTWMRSTRLVEGFIDSNKSNYIKIHTGENNLLLYRKIQNDERDGMYFKEFYNANSYLRYHFITWLTTGKESSLKILVKYFKGFVS